MSRITARGARWKTASRNNSWIFSAIGPAATSGGENQFRVLLSSFAYVLVETLRRIGLAGTELARAQAGTLRRETARKSGRWWCATPAGCACGLKSAFPLQEVFRHCVACFYG
jgi:hypothetical protein